MGCMDCQVIHKLTTKFNSLKLYQVEIRHKFVLEVYIEYCISSCVVETDESVTIEDLVDDFATFYAAGMFQVPCL